MSDLGRSLRFYQDVFGFVEMFRDGEHMVFVRPPGTSDTITLNERPDLAGVSGGIEHFGLRLKDKAQLDAAIAQVQGAGGRLIDRGARRDGSPYAYVGDPDGYVIEL